MCVTQFPFASFSSRFLISRVTPHTPNRDRQTTLCCGLWASSKAVNQDFLFLLPGDRGRVKHRKMVHCYFLSLVPQIQFTSLSHLQFGGRRNCLCSSSNKLCQVVIIIIGKALIFPGQQFQGVKGARYKCRAAAGGISSTVLCNRYGMYFWCCFIFSF